ncbi:MAG: GTP 3',8-cyclase MoaA [Oscillospiraceae bacterium]
MTDQYGRIIDYMRFSITDRCNLRCRYCMPDGVPFTPHAEILTYEELLRVATQAVKLGITKFKITGGEPLVRRGCTELIRQIKAISGVRQVTLTTNGLLLEPVLDELIDAGLDAVNISIDTLDRHKYEQISGVSGGGPDKVLRLLELCTGKQLRTKVNTVLLQENREDLIPIASLAKDLPLDVRFIELMPIGSGSTMRGASPDEALKRLKAVWPDLTPTKEVRGNGPAHYYRSTELKGFIGFIDAVSHAFCDGCNRVRLTSTGFLKPCLCFDQGTDLRLLLRSGASDEELYRAMERTIYNKPRAHRFSDPAEVTEQKKMSQIGG